MAERPQLNIRITPEHKQQWQDAADADKSVTDLTTWIKKQCDAAVASSKKNKKKSK